MVALQTGQTVLDTLMGVFNPKLGDLTWININAFAIKEDATGAIKGAYAIIEDITSRTKAQQQEKESEERFRSLFYAMSEGVALHQVIYDDLGKAKDYLILDVNPAFERQTGLTRAQVLGKCAVEAYSTPEAPFLEIYAAVAHTQKPTTFQTEFAQLGKHFSVRVFSPRRDYFATVFEDVTVRHRTESALKATQAELAEAQRLAQLGSWYWDAKTDQNIASDELCRIYGRDHIPAFAQQNGLMYPEQTWQQLNAAAQEATRTGTGFNLEVPALRGDGTLFWINTRCLAVRDPGGDVVGLRGTVQDITQRKLAEVSLQRLYSMMERTEKMAHLASFEWDIDANKVTWSPEMFRIFGRDPALGTPNLQTIAELFTPESAQLLHDAVDKAVSEGTAYELELMTLQPDAEQRPCFAHGFPERDASGRVVRLAGLVQDITERKQTQDALIQSLKDKQALLHEVHHRVKNNLQVIVSLLRLEALRSTQTDTKAVLADMQGRIRSMAFLHESLYRSGVFASIELGSYLRGLATQVFRGQANASDTVRLVVDFTPVQVSMDLATPCGLLVNRPAATGRARALVGRHHQLGIGLERGRHLARAWLRGLPALGILLGAALGQLFVGHQHVDAAVGDVDADAVAVAHQANRAAGSRFGRGVADRQARGAAREAAIGQQRAGFAQALGLDVAGGVEHLLHAGAALGAFVAHDHHVARLDLVGQDVGHRFVLRLDHVGRAFKHQQASSTPAVLTTQPFSAMLPVSTARPPSWRRRGRRSGCSLRRGRCPGWASGCSG
jgi:PAS domain S-box-containing protein